MIVKRYIKAAMLIVVSYICLGDVRAQEDVSFIEQKLSAVIWGQYMTQSCQDIVVEHWEKLPTTKCEYNSPSGFGKLPVVLLNPDNDRLAVWLATACGDAGLLDVRHCAERVALQIKCQSNNQFPIAGFVDEGPLFMFRDGVTVSIQGVDTGGQIGLSRRPSQSDIELSLNRGVVTKVWQWARVAGTGRADLANFLHEDIAQLEGINWLVTVREEYKAAWKSKRNRLISAWALSHVAQIGENLRFEAFFAQTCPPKTKWTRWF